MTIKRDIVDILKDYLKSCQYKDFNYVKVHKIYLDEAIRQIVALRKIRDGIDVC